MYEWHWKSIHWPCSSGLRARAGNGMALEVHTLARAGNGMALEVHTWARDGNGWHWPRWLGRHGGPRRLDIRSSSIEGMELEGHPVKDVGSLY